SVFTKNEMLSVVLGGIFVLETVSVITQVVSFKLTGKRVFLMAPIHHHYEKKGWAEPKIIVRFWIISILLALVSLASMKLRRGHDGRPRTNSDRRRARPERCRGRAPPDRARRARDRERRRAARAALRRGRVPRGGGRRPRRGRTRPGAVRGRRSRDRLAGRAVVP